MVRKQLFMLGNLTAFVIGCTAAWLTVMPGLPYGFDSARHLYRLVERDYLFQQGLLYTRWSPFFGYGFGSPVYNYYQPLLDYLVEPFMLVGLAAPVALQIVLSLALIAAALGTFSWVSDQFGLAAGVVATATYLFSPYLMYTLITRGGFPEVLALALMPWGLWAICRHVKRCGAEDGQRPLYGVVAALIIAAMLVAHLFTAWVYMAALLLYLCGLTWQVGRCEISLGVTGWQGMLTISWPLLAGVGLSAFFWLPAMVETNFVQVERLLALGNPAQGEGFLSVWQIFSGGIFSPISAPVVTLAPRLSWLTAGLALFGLATGVMALQSSALKLQVIVGAVVAVGCLFMMTSASLPLWQALPMLRLGQFPFRFLGLASLWLSLLAGAGTAALLSFLLSWVPINAWWKQLAAPTLVVGLSFLLSSYVLLWPPILYHSATLPLDLAAALQFERETQEVGLMAASEYLPKEVKLMPVPPTDFTQARIQLMPETLPAEAHLLEAEYELLSTRLRLESPTPFEAVMTVFYFPGWWAKINGQAVSLAPTTPYGLIHLSVPAGENVIEIGFGSTPVRMSANLLSIVVAVIFGNFMLRCTRLFYPFRYSFLANYFGWKISQPTQEEHV